MNGRRDLMMAPDPRSGFEMTMIRMLAFRPVNGEANQKNLAGKNLSVANSQSSGGVSSQAQIVNTQSVVDEEASVVATTNNISTQTDNSVSTGTLKPEDWQKIIDEMALAGMVKEFAGHCSLKEHTENLVHLILTPSQEHLLKTTQKDKLQEAIKTRFGAQVKLIINVEKTEEETPAQQRVRLEKESQLAAEQAILNDPNIQAMEKMFDATIDKESIRPLS
jgi:DNA polymerase III subunit gamma/tau